MNTRRTLLVAGALAAAASALSSYAADRNFALEQQMAEGEGYYSQYPVQSKQELTKPETSRELQRDKDIVRQLTEGDSPTSVPVDAAKAETAREMQRDRDIVLQMEEGDGGE